MGSLVQVCLEGPPTVGEKERDEKERKYGGGYQRRGRCKLKIIPIPSVDLNVYRQMALINTIISLRSMREIRNLGCNFLLGSNQTGSYGAFY